MANYQPPQSLWPRWMHVGCLGCSIVVCLAILATAASIAFWVHHETTSPSPTFSKARHLPLLALDNGCVATVRAEGYNASQGVYLPDGRVVVLATPVLDLGKMFGAAFQNAGKPNAPVVAAYGMTTQRVVLIDHGVPTDLPIPSSEDRVPSVQSFSVDDAGTHLVASVTLLDATTGTYDSGRGGGLSEVWVLDLASHSWTKLLRLPAGQMMRFAAWLPDGSAVLGRPVGQSEGKVTDLWSLNLNGHVRTVAKVPGLRSWRVLSDGGGLRLLGFTSGGVRDVPESKPQPAASSSRRIVTADLRTGAVSYRPVANVPGVHPGPLSADETLVFASSRVAALDWRAARLRYITWPLPGVNGLHAASDGAWAFADVLGSGGSSLRSSLLAINLADGRAHSVMARTSDISALSLLAAAPKGCSFLASTSGYFASPFTPEKSEVLEVYADYAALSRAPVVKPEATGGPGSPSSSSTDTTAPPGGS